MRILAARACSSCLLALTLGVSGSARAAAGPAERLPTPDSLRPVAVPVRSIDPADDDFSDLTPLVEKIGAARVVVLGEATHSEGTSDRAKARVARFLHLQMGFDVLAWETGFVQTHAMNTALRHPDVSLEQAKLYLMTGGWATAEGVHPLLEHARASWRTARPLEMTGFDKGRPAVAAPYFRKYLAELGARAPLLALTDEEWALVARLTARGYGFFGREAPREDERARERAVLERLLRTTRERRAELSRRLSERELLVAERFLVDALACEEIEYVRLTRGGEAFNTTRDRFMADTLVWLMTSLYPNRKVVVWAATAHLIRNSDLIENAEHPDWYATAWEMGNHLFPVLGDDLYTIAFTSYAGRSGEIFPEGSGTADVVNDRAPAPPDSFEAVAHAVGEPYLFVDLRSAPREHWLRGAFVSLALGRLVNTAPWSKVVDAFFFVDRAEPVRYLPLESRPGRDPKRPPAETERPPPAARPLPTTKPPEVSAAGRVRLCDVVGRSGRRHSGPRIADLVAA